MRTSTERLLRVNSRNDLIKEIEKNKLSPSRHLLLVCPFYEIKELIIEICRNNFVYSITALEDSLDFRDTAALIDTVPFFLANSQADAEDLVKRLVESPNKIVNEALNGKDVALRYTEGNPS